MTNSGNAKKVTAGNTIIKKNYLHCNDKYFMTKNWQPAKFTNKLGTA